MHDAVVGDFSRSRGNRLDVQPQEHLTGCARRIAVPTCYRIEWLLAGDRLHFHVVLHCRPVGDPHAMGARANFHSTTSPTDALMSFGCQTFWPLPKVLASMVSSAAAPAFASIVSRKPTS